MMIQQMLPPQKPLLLHIQSTSEKFFSGISRSFQDIPQAEFGAKKADASHSIGFVYILSPTDRRGICPQRSVASVRR